jgi:hypothetical protein
VAILQKTTAVSIKTRLGFGVLYDVVTLNWIQQQPGEKKRKKKRHHKEETQLDNNRPSQFDGRMTRAMKVGVFTYNTRRFSEKNKNKKRRNSRFLPFDRANDHHYQPKNTLYPRKGELYTRIHFSNLQFGITKNYQE